MFRDPMVPIKNHTISGSNAIHIHIINIDTDSYVIHAFLCKSGLEFPVVLDFARDSLFCLFNDGPQVEHSPGNGIERSSF